MAIIENQAMSNEAAVFTLVFVFVGMVLGMLVMVVMWI